MAEAIRDKMQGLSAEDQAKVNTQLQGMSQEDLAKRNIPEQTTVEPTTPVATVETPVTQEVTLDSWEVREIGEKEIAIRDKNLALQDQVNKEAQEVKTQEIEAQKVNQAEKLQKFNELMEAGENQKTLATFVNENPDYKKEFGIQLKNFYKNKQTFDYQQKYSAYTPEKLYDATYNSEIVEGTKEWNTLPESLRNSYNEYKQEQRIVSTPEERKTSIDNDTNKVLSFDDILTEVGSFFSLDLKSEYEEAINTPAISEKRTEIEGLATELKDLEDELQAIEDDVNAEYEGSGRSQSYVNAQISKRSREVEKDYNKVANRYQTSLATYSDMKSDIDRNLKFLEFENTQAKEQYQTALSLYQTERARMDTFAMAEFERKNAELATQKQQEFQKEILQIQQQFTKDNKSPTYQTDKNGNLLAIIDWVAQKVMDSNWEVVAITKEKWFTDSVSYNKEAGWYVTTRVYDDWKKPDFFVSDINWDSQTNMAVFDSISKIEDFPPRTERSKAWNGLECWEATNNYLKTVWVTDIRMWNSFESKAKYINNSYPQVWGLAVWNAEYTEFGHVGMVTGINQAEWKVEITDYNRDWDGQKQTYEIPISQVVNSDGGFVHLEAQTETWPITNTNIEVFNSLTASEKAKRQNDPDFINFIEEQSKVYSDPDADIFEVLQYSKWGKPLNATQAESISKFSATLNSLWEIQKTIEEWTDGGIFWGDKTWPIKWLLRSANPYDVTAQQLKAQITSLIPNLARWVYGEVWVLTEADVALYRQTVPNLKSTEDVNNAVLGMTLRLVRNGLKDKLQDSARAWFDASLYEGKIKRIDEQVNIIERQMQEKAQQEVQTGQTGTLMSDFNAQFDVQEYDTILNR